MSRYLHAVTVVFETSAFVSEGTITDAIRTALRSEVGAGRPDYGFALVDRETVVVRHVVVKKLP